MILYPSLFISPSPGHLTSDSPITLHLTLPNWCSSTSSCPVAYSVLTFHVPTHTSSHVLPIIGSAASSLETGAPYAYYMVFAGLRPVVSTPAGRGSTSPSEGGPVDVVAHFFYSNPSSCKSFLVSCQVVTNPLLVG